MLLKTLHKYVSLSCSISMWKLMTSSLSHVDDRRHCNFKTDREMLNLLTTIVLASMWWLLVLVLVLVLLVLVLVL